MTIDHFYHVYAGGQWRQPVEEHIQALNQSGLIDQIASMFVGYVGTADQIAEAEAFINSSLPAVTINRTDRKSVV